MVNKISFAVGIPTINRYDLLKPCLSEYFISLPSTDIYVLDNGKQGIELDDDNLHLIQSSSPISVAASWNFLCNSIFKKHTHALILNDDVFIDKREKEIIDFISLHQGADFLRSQYGFCSFVLPRKTFMQVGSFDYNFKGAYYEDRDYEYRLKLTKSNCVYAAFLNPVQNKSIESGSIKKDPSLNKNFESNAAYYKEKWGGHLNGETFLKPFNK